MTITTQDRQVTIYSQEDIALMRDTICKGCTVADFRLFLMICERTRLDPFAKQIYAVPRWDAKLGRNSMTVQTSIDGLRLVAERTGKYAPGRATVFDYDPEGRIRSATAFVKKQTFDGTWHEVACTAMFDEYCQKTKDGSPTKFWQDMSHVMIAKVAEACCLRRAFPMELSSLYTRDEMEQAEVETIENVRDGDVAVDRGMKALLSHFNEGEQDLVKEYLEKWKRSHMKSDAEVLDRFSNIEDLKKNFSMWREKVNV